MSKSRATAKERNLKTYFTGTPCKHGHVSVRRASGQCVACEQAPEFRAVALARGRTPEYIATGVARRQTLEYKAAKIASYFKMPIEIPNRPRPANCECCGGASDRPLQFDHCHDTGRFRGWCCPPCNGGPGIMDNPKRLRLRALYLERSFSSGPVNWAYATRRTNIAKSET